MSFMIIQKIIINIFTQSQRPQQKKNSHNKQQCKILCENKKENLLKNPYNWIFQLLFGNFALVCYICTHIHIFILSDLLNGKCCSLPIELIFNFVFFKCTTSVKV